MHRSTRNERRGTKWGMAKNLKWWFFALLLLLFAMLLRGQAQAQSSGFAGRVTDLVSGKAIVGATVEVGATRATTGAEGRYTLPLPPGMYSLHTRAPGYIGMSQTLQRVPSQGYIQVDFAMVLQDPSPEEAAIIDAKLMVTEQPPPGPRLLATLAKTAEHPETTTVPKVIRILMPDDTVVVMDMDEYLKGVVPHEMSAYWPMEALKAQAVAARSYAATARAFPEKGADVDTTTRTQVWSPTHYDTSDGAVEETHNEAVRYAGGIIHAFFFAACPGHTRSSEEVWGGYLPYARSVPCIDQAPGYRGHGVGMCQQGARAYALAGYDYRRILAHYYTGAQPISPSPPTLSGAGITPQEGATETLFTFYVIYSDGDGDVPRVSDVYIDGVSHVMNYVSGDHRTGARYEYVTTLPDGNHTFSFAFNDGYNPVVSTQVFQGPQVTRGLAPPRRSSPSPRPESIKAGLWRQTSTADFAGGGFSNMSLVSLGQDAMLALGPSGLSGIYTSKQLKADFPFVALAAKWEAELPPGTSLELQVCTSFNGQEWSDWLSVPPADIEPSQRATYYGELIFASGQMARYRFILTTSQEKLIPKVGGLTLTYIDSRPGPTIQEAALGASPLPSAQEVKLISRAGWGADEALMNWPPEYRTARKFILHHTVTDNYDLDPVATVRAIYYYHAVVRGWGDIGYNYLIDQQGNIYEGRYGGEGVVGGHAQRYNWGSIGIAGLGNYDTAPVPQAVKAAWVQLVADKANRHFIDPKESGYFIDGIFPNVVGHRELLPTTCPGGYLYAWLPTLRNTAAERMQKIAPYVELASPDQGEAVAGQVAVEAKASLATTEVEFVLDDVPQMVITKTPYIWQWDSTAASEGEHLLTVTARTASGLEATASHRVAVNNQPPSGWVKVAEFSPNPRVTVTLHAVGADYVQFSNLWLWEGEEMLYEVGQIVEDAAASGGKAWMARAGEDEQGALYGPYAYDLPPKHSYRAYFRMKVGDNSSPKEVALLDVVDNAGQRTFGELSLKGTDFPRPHHYREFHIDFDYPQAGAAGLEFRLAFRGIDDVYLDRVWVFSSPQPYAARAPWNLKEDEGRQEFATRFLDSYGALSPPYTASVTVDLTAPEWLGWGDKGAGIRDQVSGLELASAEYSFSNDGGTSWSGWRGARVTGSGGPRRAKALAPSEIVKATHLRFRIRDRAGNLAISPAYPVEMRPPATPLATPSPTPLTGTLATVEVELGAGWNLIGAPLELGTAASGVLAQVDSQGGEALELDRWQAGGWVVHLKGLPLNDFPFEIGAGHFLRTGTSSTWRMEGRVAEAPVKLRLKVGWNLIAMPYATTLKRASDLVSAIQGQGGACDEVDRWVAGAWQTHRAGLPLNDFPLKSGEGYFLHCTAPCKFTPP